MLREGDSDGLEVTTSEETTAQALVKGERFILLNRICLFFRGLRTRISWGFRCLKWKIQRFRRGYADTDVWNMNDWFIGTVRPMLQQLLDGHAGYPVNITNARWEEELMYMIRCLDNMDEEKVAEDLQLSDTYTAAAYRKINEVMDRNKNEFFRVFSEHFWNLWD